MNTNEHLWGSFEEAGDRVVAHGSIAEKYIDLLDYAALMTLRHGGSVMPVDRAAPPPPALAAAMPRY